MELAAAEEHLSGSAFGQMLLRRCPAFLPALFWCTFLNHVASSCCLQGLSHQEATVSAMAVCEEVIVGELMCVHEVIPPQRRMP